MSTTRAERSRGWSLVAVTAASNLGDGVARATIPIIAALAFESSPSVVAGATAILSLSWFGVFLAGAVIDRSDRKDVMRRASYVRAAFVATLAIYLLFADVTIAMLYTVALAVGAGEIFFETSASALVPEVVPHARLRKMNGRMHAAQIAFNDFVGPALGGVLAGVSLSGSASVAAAGYLGAWAGGGRIPRGAASEELHQPRQFTMDDVLGGFRYLGAHRGLGFLVAASAALNLSSGVFFALFVLYALSPRSLALSPAEYGILLSIGGLGGIVASVVISLRGFGWTPRSILTIGLGVQAVTAIAIASISNVVLVGVALALGGATVTVVGIVVATTRHEVVPAAILGRVTAAFWTISLGAYPLGSMVGGLLAEGMGVRTAIALAAVPSVLGAAALVSMARADEPFGPRTTRDLADARADV